MALIRLVRAEKGIGGQQATSLGVGRWRRGWQRARSSPPLSFYLYSRFRIEKSFYIDTGNSFCYFLCIHPHTLWGLINVLSTTNGKELPYKNNREPRQAVVRLITQIAPGYRHYMMRILGKLPKTIAVNRGQAQIAKVNDY
ncbi:TPA: hypothetical protein DIC39_00230 [Patescibacteria group bacterium]|nr:hypothetical protein [Patescibacteria group bacterium]HCU47482.1 hypothetical protein [Patescibacteria group bacterium]